MELQHHERMAIILVEKEIQRVSNKRIYQDFKIVFEKMPCHIHIITNSKQ